jgi:hypothetical protein
MLVTAAHSSAFRVSADQATSVSGLRPPLATQLADGAVVTTGICSTNAGIGCVVASCSTTLCRMALSMTRELTASGSNFSSMPVGIGGVSFQEVAGCEDARPRSS